MNPIAIKLSGRHVIQVAVPDILGALGQFDALEFAAALTVEQAKLDLLCVGGEQRKVGAPAVQLARGVRTFQRTIAYSAFSAFRY